jgi:hypothetical protein
MSSYLADKDIPLFCEFSDERGGAFVVFGEVEIQQLKRPVELTELATGLGGHEALVFIGCIQ